MKRSILVLTENFPNNVEPYRGVYVLEQLREIVSEYDVHVIVPLNVVSWSIIKFISHERIKNIEGISVYYIKYFYMPFEWILPPLRSLNRIFQRWLILRLIFKLANKLHKKLHFKVLHGHEIIVGDLVAPIGKKLGLPSIFSIHSLLKINIQYFGQKVVNDVLENVKRTDAIIAVSNLSKNAYESLVDMNKIKVVYNGVNTKKLNCSEVNRENILNLLSVCNLIEIKKIDLVLSVLREIKYELGLGFTYHIVGGGSEKKYLSRLIKEYKLSEHVKLVGIIPPDDISSFYSECDIFVLPSIGESFGIVFLEAMYCGKPVICSSYSGITEIIEDGKQGFIVHPNDTNDLKHKLRVLMTDDKLRYKMGKEARKLAETMTIDKQIQHIFEIYNAFDYVKNEK